MTVRRIMIASGVVVLLGLMAGCAAGPNPAEAGGGAGFWLGLWQGFIAPFALIVSFFNDHVRIYEVNNNGGWYNFGFVLGASIFFGGGGGAGARASRRK
jgi:hypothetical protein